MLSTVGYRAQAVALNKVRKVHPPFFIQIWGVEEQLHILLTLEQGEGEWLASLAGRFTPEEKDHSSHSVEGWVGPRIGLDVSGNRKKSIDPAGNRTFIL